MNRIILFLGLFSLVRIFAGEAEEVAFGVLILAAIIPSRKPVAPLLLAVLVCAVVHIQLYHLVTGLRFSFFQIWESPVDAVDSVLLFVGIPAGLALLAEFVLLTIGLAVFFERIWSRLESAIRLPRSRPGRAVVLALMLFPAARHAVAVGTARWNGTPPFPLAFEGADRTDLPKADESLIVVQLESVNSAVIFDGDPIPLPALEKVAQMGGVWIPHIWANHFGTHLGMSSILCGTSGIMSARFVLPADGGPCMPERFRRAGFRTAFFYSFRDAEFYHIKDHVKTLGFDEFHYGSNLMRPEDPLFEWGYEDCRFYDRALENMKGSGLDVEKKAFVYLSVHMNHVPFSNHLAVSHPFEPARDFREKYLNSAYEQEICLGRFLEKVEALGRDDLNVLVVGDHGFPVDSKWEVYDGFATSLYFIPAKRRQAEFKTGPRADALVGQDQIVNTMLELFGAPRVSSSFLWLLKGEDQPADYRSCVFLSDLARDVGIAMTQERSVTKRVRSGEYVESVYKDRRLVSVRSLEAEELRGEFSPGSDCLSRFDFSATFR